MLVLYCIECTSFQETSYMFCLLLNFIIGVFHFSNFLGGLSDSSLYNICTARMSSHLNSFDIFQTIHLNIAALYEGGPLLL